jgi:hypothetical protein
VVSAAHEVVGLTVTAPSTAALMETVGSAPLTEAHVEEAATTSRAVGTTTLSIEW